MQFCKKLETLRKSKKMTQDFLADKLGVSRQTIYKWEAGENKPEVEKLVTISKIFDVSLDVLLNDNIELTDQNQAVVSIPTPTFRDVFISSDKIDLYQSGIDHGCPKNYKGVNKKYDEIFCKRNNEHVKEFKGKGYNEVVRLCNSVTISFFIDRKKKVFGLYGNHHEYFVCPFENFISVSRTGGGQELGALPQTGVTAMFGGIQGVGVSQSQVPSLHNSNNNQLIISYYDKNGRTERYTIPFNFSTSHLWRLKDIASGKNSSLFLLDTLENSQVNSSITAMQKVLGYLAEIKAIADRERSNGTVNEPLDIEEYQKHEKEGLEKHNEYLNQLSEETAKHNKKHLIKNIVEWSFFGVGAVFIIGLIVYCVLLSI